MKILENVALERLKRLKNALNALGLNRHVSPKAPSRYVFEGATIKILHNSGFFSNCSVSLHAITEYSNLKKSFPELVDFSCTFENFKNLGSSHLDVYSEYFCLKSSTDFEWSGSVNFPLYSLFDYREQNYPDIVPYIEKYFNPSTAVMSRVNSLQQKYSIDFDNLLVICYRGTDKYIDTPLASFQSFIDAARLILERFPGLQVLVQTDQQQFVDYARQELGAVIVFDELPRTTSSTVMHSLVTESKVEWTQTFLAVTYLMSQARHLVLHTGNVARWVCLYRGGTDNIFQYFHPKDKANGYWISPEGYFSI